MSWKKQKNKRLTFYNMFTLPLRRLLIASMICLHACVNIDVFEKNISIPGHEWSGSFIPEVSFMIADTASPYNIYAVIRHSDAYRYNNIWLNIYAQPPGDSTHKQRVDLRLATDSEGWLGSGMDDIYEHRILLARTVFQKPGLYRFQLENIMREDPLQHVFNVGVRIEKAN